MTPRAALNALLSSDDLHALETRVRRVSSFHILGIDRRELSHAALLAWLLDPRGSHGMGAEPLRRFALLAARQSSRDHMLDAVDLDQLDLTDALVETECWVDVPDRVHRRRLDILVSATVPGGEEPVPIVLIEYKVDASEGDDQTVDYAAWAATQRLRLGDRDVLPLQIYLCLVADDEQAPAPPFVTIGYDAYLGWADAVGSLEKTAQAQALLDEWRACLLARNDVVDEAEVTLLSELTEAHGEAIRALRNANAAELARFRHVLEQHAEAFTRLGVRVRRRGGPSKGYSAAVALTRDVLDAKLARERWNVTGGEGSVRAVFLPFVEIVAEWADGKARTSGLRVQAFADRPQKGRFRISFEVIGSVPGLEPMTSKAIRLAAAEGIRTVLRASGSDLPLRQGAMIASFPIDMPAVPEPEADTDENVARHRDELESIAERILALEEPLQTWCERSLRDVLEARVSVAERR